MKDGFIKVAAATPKIKVADPAYNTEEILKIIDETEKNGASILVFSELTISGYTCGDLFLQQPLLTECKNQLLRIVKATEDKSMLVVVGCPIVIKQKLYNCAVVISDGNILGIVKCQFDSMVCDTSLWIVVCSDLFRTVSCSDLALSLRCFFIVCFLLL